MKELEIRLNKDNTISFNDYIETRIAYEELCKELSKEKDKEIERLNNIINKAIYFLKENACIDEDVEYFCDDLRYDDCKKLLEILKGNDDDSQDECEDFDKIVFSDDLEKYRQVNGILNDEGNKIFCQRVNNYLDKKRK